MPLVNPVDASVEEISQYRLFQVRVFEKAVALLDRYTTIEPNETKRTRILYLLQTYGSLLNGTFDLELERDLAIQQTFSELQELI